MPELITRPALIEVPGDKLIREYLGRVVTGTEAASLAWMVAPPGWSEPAQTPEFDEVTLVLRGRLRVEHAGGSTDVVAGTAIITRAGERVRYLVPDGGDAAEYVALCLPAFAPELAHREE
jgi:ethanolamine utilization protein EutQ (cupin superfamily)